MATNYITLTGIIEWAHHLFIPDEYEGIRKWKCNFYPDEKSKELLKASGSKKRFKTGSFGEFVSLTRDVEKEFRRGEGPKPLTPPDVQDAEGNKWEDGKPIGNGSKVTVRLEIYDAGRMGKGTRLNAVRVDELVEYTRPEVSAPSQPMAPPF